MLVLLRENVENLGRVGDVVKVSDGYARNFLLPNNLVVAANENNIKELEHQKRSLDKKRLAQKATLEELAQRLNAHTLTLNRKVGEHDKLFGSVSNADIQVALKEAGFDVEKRTIQLIKPIKALGNHQVAVRLDAEVVANLKVVVSKTE